MEIFKHLRVNTNIQLLMMEIWKKKTKKYYLLTNLLKKIYLELKKKLISKKQVKMNHFLL